MKDKVESKEPKKDLEDGIKKTADEPAKENAKETAEEIVQEAAQEKTPEEGDITKPSPEAEKADDSKKGKKKGKKKKEKKKLTEKQKTVRALRRLLTKLVVVGALAAVLLLYVGSVAVCHDNNMFPAVRDGDLIITYRLGGYYNDDIVLYEMGGVRRIGRVVAIPGDVVDINDEGGFYTLNGTMPYETIYFATRKAPDSTVNFPYTVQEGEVFIFNDMRDNTYDSRVFGGVSELQGKVVLLIRRRGF